MSNQTLYQLTQLIAKKHEAKTVLFVASADPNQAEWDYMPTSKLLDKRFTAYYDLAAVDLSAKPIEQQGVQISTRLRDLLARRVLIQACATDELYGLGFHEIKTQELGLEQTQVRFWQFNILEYKQVPDWLNARFWANPQNFNKYRW